MTLTQIKERTQVLLGRFLEVPGGSRAFELFNGTLSLLIAFYGGGSTQVKTYVRDAEQIREKTSGACVANHIGILALGTLRNLAAELGRFSLPFFALSGQECFGPRAVPE